MAILDAKAPPPEARTITPDGLAKLNFEMGRRSIADEARADLNRRIQGGDDGG